MQRGVWFEDLKYWLCEPIGVGLSFLKSSLSAYSMPCMKWLPLVRACMKTAYGITRVYRFFVRPVSVAVKIMFVRDGRILLVRHTYRPGLFLPGGSVKRGETIEQAARREAAEEVGARIERLALFGLYSGIRRIDNDHIAVFVAEGFELGRPKGFEIEAAEFHDMKALPAETARPAAKRIAEYMADPTRSTRCGKW